MNNFEKKLNGDYNSSSAESFISLAKITLLFPILGVFYLWIYFDSFGISYFDSFNIPDSIAVLYQKLMRLILILFSIFNNTTLCGISNSIYEEKNKGTLNVLFVSILVIFGILSLWVLCDVNKFPISLTLIILAFVRVGSLAYLF